MSVDISCLYSTVKNTSGAEAHFPFLGSNGVNLAEDGEYSQWGDIRERVANIFGGFGRQEESLEGCLVDGSLTIVKTPPPILYDETLDQSVMLVVDDDTLAAAPVCWLEPPVTTTPEPTTPEPTTTGGG
jgi:hypothetical protein